MAITRTLTKTFKTITRSKSSPFLRKQHDDDEDDNLTPLHPCVPPPKQLRLNLDFAETLNLDFHQLDFSDDSKLEAWTQKNTPKEPMDEASWLGERVGGESRDRKSVLAPESVSNGFFESPLSTPVSPGGEWPDYGLRDQLSRDPQSHPRDPQSHPRDLQHPTHHQSRGRSFVASDLPPSPKSPTTTQTTTQKHPTSRDKSLPKPPVSQRPAMSHSKSCSHLPKRSKSHNSSDKTKTHASQFVKSRVASESHVTSGAERSSHVTSGAERSSHVTSGAERSSHVTERPGHVTGQTTNRPIYLNRMTTPANHGPTPSMDSFVTCTDASPQLPASSPSRDLHQRNMSIASVDTVAAYVDPALASTISRYYHLEGVRESRDDFGESRDQNVATTRNSRDHPGARDTTSSRLSNRHSRDLASRDSVPRDLPNRQSRQSNESPFNTPSLDDRNSSSTFTMSPSTSTTMSTPSLVDSPSSCASMNVTYEKQGHVIQAGHVVQTQPLQVTPAPARPCTMYSDNDLVPPPRSKYRSRHYRFDSGSSSVYSNNYVKEDYMGALRQSLYVARDDEAEESSPNLRPNSAFFSQLSADDYANAIQEGQWF